MKIPFLSINKQHYFDNYAETIGKPKDFHYGFVMRDSLNIYRIYFDGKVVFSSKNFSKFSLKQTQLFKKYNLKFTSV